MATITEIRTRISEIDTLLAAGIRSTSSGEYSIDYDLEALRKERNRLQRIVSNSSSSQFRRVVFKNA